MMQQCVPRVLLAGASSGCGKTTVTCAVLDEAVSACNNGVICEDRVTQFLRARPEGLEVALTGRNPSAGLLEVEDYVTEMRKRKHPFDKGIPTVRGWSSDLLKQFSACLFEMN